MRQIGTLPDAAQAERFTAYLITQAISAVVEPAPDGWQVWVREEDHLAEAKAALQEFTAEPEHPRYRGAIREATSRLQKEDARRERARRNMVSLRGQWPGAGGKRHPLSTAMIALCAVVFVMAGFGRNEATPVGRVLGFRDPLHRMRPDGEDAAWDGRLADITRGQLWRLVTPIFLHGAVWHLVFNLMMFYAFATRIEQRRGTWHLALLILGTAVASNVAQALAPSDWGPLSGGTAFCGLSGVVYGLLGYLWMKAVFDPGAGLSVSQGTLVFLLIFLVAGCTGVLDKVATALVAAPDAGGAAVSVRLANVAHLVGLLAGMAIGYGASRPRRG